MVINSQSAVSISAGRERKISLIDMSDFTNIECSYNSTFEESTPISSSGINPDIEEKEIKQRNDDSRRTIFERWRYDGLPPK